MANAQCPRCGLVNWETDVNCRRCGTPLQADKEAAAPGSTLPLKKFVLFLVVAGVVALLAVKYWFASPSPPGPTSSTVATSVNKKPLNTPGEEIDVRQYLASDKHTVVYFYADW